MGTDNLFHKKRQARHHLRREASKSYGSRKSLRVLIVSDDSKSAVYYFEALRDDLGLTQKKVEIDRKGGGFDQKSLVDYAISKFDQEKELLKKRYGLKEALPYDRVYCVFDQDAYHYKDSHQKKYQEALNEIDRINAKLALPDDIFKAITSVPCYEFWLLLHCQFMMRSFANTQQRSVCDMVISELKSKECMPHYDKKDKKIYAKTKEKLTTAIKNAERVEIERQKIGTDNPSTLIHLLVKDLQGMSGSTPTS